MSTTSRLSAELQRLFLPTGAPAPPVPAPAAGAPAEPAPTGPPTAAAWADGAGRLRVLALALASEAGWPPLAALWQGVQAELGLPAPAIAVNGRDGLQLWFALAQPVAVDEARAVLAALRQRFLAQVPPHRIGQWPPAPGAGGAAGATTPSGPAVDALPPQRLAPDRWSAFVSPDLAPVFADTPWLEIPPGDEAQASLLARLQPASAGAWAEACRRLMPAAAPAPDRAAARAAGDPAGAPENASHEAVGAFIAGQEAVRASAESPVTGHVTADDRAAARRFLRAVVDDGTAPLALRIEAARALLLAPPTAP